MAEIVVKNTEVGLFMATYCLVAVIAFIGGLFFHTCPEKPPHTRHTLKLHLAVHGEVSRGKWITKADSKLWNLCEVTCNPDPDYIKVMAAEEKRVLGDVK